jgi:FkbM family methyltransferase
MQRQLRNLQTLAPWVRPLKFNLYNLATRHLGWHIDPDFQILKRLPQARLALDIGGNWGQSIETIRRLRPAARIVSFEPNPVLARRLERAFAGSPAVTVKCCALSEQAGQMRLHVPSYRGFVYDGLASLDYDEAYGWLNADRVAGFDPALLSVTSFDVEVARLDDFGLAPDFIKIDVQGHELAVLRGATQTLQHKPVVMLEGARPEIVALMADFGLAPYALMGEQLVAGRIDTNNTIFMTDGLAAATGLAIA